MKLPAVCERIRRGQIWKKRETFHGRETHIIIRNRGKDDYWHTVGVENRKSQHRIKQKDIWRFYDLVGAAGNRQSENIRI